jgi:hypothetical protein
VRRLSWDTVVRLNRYLEIVGKTATAIWCAFIASVVLGVDWRDSGATWNGSTIASPARGDVAPPATERG